MAVVETIEQDEVRALLMGLLRRPAWHRDALCLEYPDVDFFPGRGESMEPAQAVCRRCLVRDACLTDALDTGQEHGVWGATTGRGRQELGLLRRCSFAGCGQAVARANGYRCTDHQRACGTPGCVRERVGRARWCSACRRGRRPLAA